MSMGRRAYNLLRGYVNREWDRINGIEMDTAEQELLEYKVESRPPADPPPIDHQEHARRLLGVGKDAPFAEVRKAFERLSERSSAKNFPAGSEESVRAAEIHQKVHWAYQQLSSNVDPTEKRFRSLEID